MFDQDQSTVVQDPHSAPAATVETPVPDRPAKRPERRPTYSVESLIDFVDPHGAVFEDATRPARQG